MRLIRFKNICGITHLSRKEPKEQIGVVLFIDRKEAGITRNVVREWPTADSRQSARFLNIPSFNVWCKEQSGTHFVCQWFRKTLGILVSVEMRRQKQLSRSRDHAPC